MTAITIIKDIEPDQIDMLKSLGIRTTEKLLEAASTRQGRRLLAERSAAAAITSTAFGYFDEQQLLRWANIADKLRIKGMGKEYAELLCHAGVDTVRELQFRNAGRLARSMATVNFTRSLVRFLPPQPLVTRWIEQAKTLPQMISY
jgi:predicted RecB family nuclease